MFQISTTKSLVLINEKKTISLKSLSNHVFRICLILKLLQCTNQNARYIEGKSEGHLGTLVFHPDR